MARPATPPWLRALGARAVPYLLPLAVSLAIGWVAVGRILERAGHPALPLDDSFIHLQYAQRLAKGHFFSYSPGTPYSAGATSLLWPALMVPFFALGVGGLDAIWVAWALGTWMHAATALETFRLTDRLAGRTAAWGAGAMCLAFGAFAWFAWSGMETMVLPWILMRSARVAVGHVDAGRLDRRVAAELIGLGLLGPLVRPEGGLTSLFAALALLMLLKRGAWRRRGPVRWLIAGVPMLGPLQVPALHRIMSGSASSSTAQVKWMLLDPYLSRDEVVERTLANVKMMATDLLDGGRWTSVFLPEHFTWPLALGLLALPWIAHRRRAHLAGLYVAVTVAGTFAVCTYSTMLWNRVRYMWPFAPAWFAAIACGAAAVGELLSRRRALFAIVTPTLLGGAAAWLGMKLDWATSDLAQSARAIDRQQVTLGRWARHNTPPLARLGINDTGAIAYMSGRQTFDVVGLTTLSEARYWVAGRGSRFEHYERLPASVRPTHFIVYPGWMGIPALLGDELTRATVIEQSILGGRTMVAYRARYDRLMSGDLPVVRPGRLVDALDVADLESEAEHGYVLGWARSHLNVVRSGPLGETDGGRLKRLEDRFWVHASGPTRMIARVHHDDPLEVWFDGKRVATIPPSATAPWVETVIDLPAPPSPRAFVVVRPSKPHGSFASYHYWWYAAD